MLYYGNSGHMCCGLFREAHDDALLKNNDYVILLKAFTDKVEIVGRIDNDYYVKYHGVYWLTDSIHFFSYNFDSEPLCGMIERDRAKQIAILRIVEEYRIANIENYHVDVLMFSCADDPASSMYVVNIYAESPDYNVYYVHISCITGEVYYSGFAKHIVG